jgi:hypothetical protein
LAVLTFLDKHFVINAAMKQAVFKLCDEEVLKWLNVIPRQKWFANGLEKIGPVNPVTAARTAAHLN